MKRIRYLTLLMTLLCGIIARAQDDFNPESPAEPDQIATKLTLVADPADGGTVSGGGRYSPGTNVTANAYENSGFKFVNWTNEAGTVVSTDASYSFAKGDLDEKLTANFAFLPDAPAEPDELKGRFRVKLVGEEGYSSISGAGVYTVGASVTVNVYTLEGFDFIGWYEGDELKSSDTQYTFTMEARPLTLTARFNFNPDAPAEPDELIAVYRLNLLAEEGGSVSVSPSGTRFEVGTSLTLTASTNTGYEFTGWYKDGEFYTADNEFVFVMEAKRVEFKAHYKYVPDSPLEPETAGERTFSFTLYNVNCKPGDTVDYPIYFTWNNDLKDISFQLTFNENLQPDLSNYEKSEKASSYNVSYTNGETIAGNNAYVFTLSDGTLEGSGNTILLSFKIPIPSTMETGLYYPVTINQISVTNADGSTQTAGARNGRVSVYKNGDSNGDNEVDILDQINLITHITGKQPEVFIEEVSNVNGDEEVDVLDAIGVIEIILNK